jgi:Domain of unknown function (DUF6487)
MAARNQHECPYCRVNMEEGVVLDRQHHGRPGPQTWTEAPLEKSFWTGVKLTGKQQFEVATWRCPDCGFLASFAN